MQSLDSVIRRTLQRSDVGADEIGVISPGATHQVGLATIEHNVISRVLAGTDSQTWLRVKDAVGECFSVSGALQLAALLGHWQQDGHGEIGLVISVGHEGNAGAVIVRRGAALNSQRHFSGNTS